jgi:hypothetical protein
MPLAALLTALFGAMGSIASGGFQAAAANRATSSAERSKRSELDWEREAAGLAQQAQDEENRRRQIEASFRAAKLEDVIGMFQNLEGLGSLGTDAGRLRNVASQLMSHDGEADLRKAALMELDRNSGALNAMLAQAGVRGSGFAAGQQRGLATDTMMGLARDIASNRQQNLLGGGQLLGQAANINQMMANFDLNKLGAIGNLYQDEAFGANAPDVGNLFGGYTGADWTSNYRRPRKNPVI